MKQLAAACKAFRAAYASLLFMLMILVGASSHAYAQSGTIINPNGGNTTTDGLAIKITDTNIVVRRNGIWEAANVAGAAGDQGIRPYIIFEKRLSASGSPSIHRIQNRFISQITGTGDVSSPWQVIMTDTVSNFDHKRYTINTTISYTAGDNYFFLDYVILAPPGTESYYVHLYHSERIWMGGSGCSMGQAGELINWDEYRGPAVLLPDIVRVYRPENECSNLPFDAHIYRTSGGFTSYFASNPDLRDEKLVPGYLLRSVTNASLFPEPSKGISVHKMIEFNGTLGSSYYEPKTKRILVGYGLDTTFNGLDYTDPFVANNSTGVTVGFTADSVGVAEGDDTHILDGLKIRVSTGVLTSPQLLKIKVKPHTSAGVTNTDYEYLGALVIQPNVYATPVEIDITNILIKGNTSLQPNRSMQLELESGTPLVNIDPAANIAAYTILDDDNGKIALEPIDTLLHEGQSMQVRVKLNGGIAGEDITVTIDKGSNTDAQDEDYQVATPFPFTVTIPAGSNEATFTLTAATDQIIEKPTQLLELTATATVSGLTKFAKANVNIVDETRLNPDNMVIRIDDILGAYEGDFFWVRVSLPAGITTEEELKVTISVDPTKSTTDNADFDPIPTEITINPGESSAIIEYLSILLDDKIEFKEECWLNGYAEGFTVEPGVIEVEDVDYDPGNPWGNMYTDPFVFTIEEGDPAGVTFVVTLPGNKIAGKDFDLDLSLEGGSTAEAADFVNFPSKVTFPKNASEFRFTLYPDHDDEEESDEDAYVLLSSPYFSFYSVPVTIINKPVDNNSGDKNIKLEPEAIEVLEGGTVKVWVKLASNVAATQDLTFNIAAGSGTSADLPAGAYTFPSTVMIHTGETKASFDVVATGDNNILELARDLDIVVSGDVYGFAASADTIITIKDLTSTIPANKVISLTVPASITEGETKTITAALPTGITASYPITVSLSQVAVPSSVDAADFVGGLPTQIVIAKGAPSGMISVEAVKDHKHEPTEYLQMKPTAAGFTFGGNVNGSGNLEMSVINYDEAISMSATTTTVQEGATAVTVTVALANSVLAGENIVVNLQRDAASTAAATDFDLSATSVTILQGTNSASFTFTAKDDNILEGDEIATIRGTNVNGYTINGISFTITDKTSTVAANKVLTIASDSTSLFEGNSATVWVRLPENITTATAITVSLSRGASSDAALLASEYSFPATVTIPANGNEISFTLTATGDDNLFERNERLEINATANVWGTANNINEDVDIKDITITKAANRVVNITTPASIKEGNTGRIVFRLPAGISTTYPITFSLVNNGSTTVAADFSGGFPTEAIIPANNDSAFVTISPIADNSVEGTETLKLTAGSADGFTFNGGINIDIEDEDVSGIIALTASPLGMTEGDPAKVVTVSLPSGAVAGKDIVVNLSKNASSTASASDHSALPTSVTIKKDSSFTTFTVAALDDDLLEREETLVITGTNSDGYTVSGITLLIADKTSDIPANVAITLTADSTTILEGNSTKVFVRLPSNITTTEAITVNLSRGALSDAALQASEYSFPTTVTIPANSNEGSFTLTASADDNVLEGLENLQIAASANVFGTTSTATTTVGIADKTSTIAANKVITITAPTSIKEGETKSITASLPSGISTATPITVTLTNNG
ncbi:Calx-beta domain-containing protein, partial [Chitinophaga skermanii]